MASIILHLLFLLCVCTYNSAEIDTPDYITLRDEIIKTKKTLDANLLSMEPEIPPLNDPRRHFAEIINVIAVNAKYFQGCAFPPYDYTYDRNLNSSTVEGIANPQGVIDLVKNLVKELEESFHVVSDIIKKCTSKDKVTCNKQTETELKTIPATKTERFLAAGSVAKHFNVISEELVAVSKDLSAHKYVIQQASALEKTIIRLGHVLGVLNPFHIGW